MLILNNIVNPVYYCLSRADGFPLKAASNLLGVERIAFHQHLDQTSNRIALSSHDRAGALELLVDQLGRTLLNLVEQTLAALLVRVSEVNRPETAHTKLTDHRPRNLNRTLDIIRSAGSHRGQQNLLRGATTKQQRDLIFEILALLHK